MGELIETSVDGGVALCRLDRPEARNALSPELMLELGAALEAFDADPEVHCIVIAGSDEVFAAGADIKAMATFGPEEITPVVGALGDALDLLESLPKISIAAVNGYALGGGFELALAADLRYLATDATVGQPEVTIGVIPGAGGTQRIARLAGVGVARDLVFTGRMVPAEEALGLRLAERVEDPDGVLDRAMADARGFAAGPRRALAAAKEALRAAVGSPGSQGIATEKRLFVGLFGGTEQREGMAAFLEKRPPDFRS
jgi:enoyl-CoA hydratase/carnithine racemase